MRMILSLFLVLLFVTGCGPDGREIARDFVEGLEDALELDDVYEEGEDIDCSDPSFTTFEPLPEGRYPEEVTGRGGVGIYWDCAQEILFYYSDGSSYGNFIGEFDLSTIDEDTYGLLEDVYSCRAAEKVWPNFGSPYRELPDFAGRWVVTDDNQFCYRINYLPGVINCYPYESFPDGPVTVEQIHQGEVINRFSLNDSCAPRRAE